MTTLAELDVLIAANEDAFQGLTIAYQAMLGGIPSIDGYFYLFNAIESTNYGSYDHAIEFDRENIFINIAASLVSGNTEAAAEFRLFATDMQDLPFETQVARMYKLLAGGGQHSEEGRAYLTRPEALSYYEQVAQERGIAGELGAAVAAFGAIASIVMTGEIIGEDKGWNNHLSDLRNAITDGSAQIPQSSTEFTYIDDADGFNYDGDDHWIDIIDLDDLDLSVTSAHVEIA